MQKQIWTIAEAKARLSEILRRASNEGPQRIGTRNSYVVVPEKEWLELCKPKPPLGKWLLDHMPRGEALELPDRTESDREIPFAENVGSEAGR